MGFIKMLKRQNKGFTLVEMIVSLVILGILLTTSVMGLMAWQDWSDFNKENEYAETMFFAAQNQLTEYSANGTLSDFAMRAYTGSNIVDLDSIYYDINKRYTAATILDETLTNGPEEIKKVWQNKKAGTLCYVKANRGDYNLYLSNQPTVSETAPIVFELLESYVYDAELLNGTICLEFSLEDGQMFSALYTDKSKSISDEKYYSEFTYEDSTETRGLVNISNREESYRKERMVGYYGVDTLSNALRGGKQKPTISNLSLNNEDTLNLAIKLGKCANATNRLKYEIGIFDQEKDRQILKLVLDTSSHPLKSYENRETVPCTVFRFVYDDDDGNSTLQDLGEMDFIAYLDDKNQVRLVLDAADITATSNLYKNDFVDLQDAEKVKKDSIETNFANTFSFHRFGINVEKIYCTVFASGKNYNASSVKESNIEHAYFDSYEFVNENKDEKKTRTYTYNISNSRHLYNVRYLEDYTETELKNQNENYENIDVLTFCFEVKKDIDWAKFVEDGHYYNSKTEMHFDADYLQKGYFASINQLRFQDSFNGNDYTISGLSIAEAHNNISKVYGDNPSEKPVGLFNKNYGTIKYLSLDKIKVKSSTDKVGAVCGVNVCGQMSDGTVTGVLTELYVKNTGINTEEASFVIGKEHVGGVVGYLQGITEADNEESSDDNSIVASVTLEKLNNAAKVTGERYVGGIIGEVRTPKNKAVQITVSKCNNIGAVLASGSTVDSEGNIVTKSDINPEDCKYIGGITGYCANMYVYKDGEVEEKYPDLITISECVSNPVFSDSDLAVLLNSGVDQAAEKLSEKLNGVYVGGIVGYNYYSTINKSSTYSGTRKQGYVFGYEYVGGIVGFNQGPASGIKGGNDTQRGVNEANVVGYEYVGGITGCNAKLDEDRIIQLAKEKGYQYKDKNNNYHDYDSAISVIENTDIIVIPLRERLTDVKIENWKNKGIIFATGRYAGGISGYNSGWIYSCNSEVENSDVNDFFQSTYSSGDYAGGIAGYNNGVIGNTIRSYDLDNNFVVTDARTENAKKISAICYISGKNYVGGIVGYNDVDGIVEDYEVAGGYIRGDENKSFYVGGYVGFNASVNLLQKDDGSARALVAKPNEITGQYFVGGCVGGNIINTANLVASSGQTPGGSEPGTDPDEPTDPDGPSGYLNNDDFVYGEIVCSGTYNEYGTDNWITSCRLIVTNKMDVEISDWYIDLGNDYSISIYGYDLMSNGLYKPASYFVIPRKSYTNEQEGKTDLGGFRATGSKDVIDSLPTRKLKIYYKLPETQESLASSEDENIIELVGDGASSEYEGLTVTFEKAYDNVWGPEGSRRAQYKVEVVNGTSKNITDWDIKIKVNCENGFSLRKEDVYNAEVSIDGDIITFTSNNTPVIYAGQTYSFQFQMEVPSDADISTFLESSYVVSSDGTIIYSKGNISGADEETNKKIYTQFLTDNFLGTLEGTAFIGGYMGYNLLIDNQDQGYDQGYVYELQNKIVQDIKAKEGNLLEQYCVMEGLVGREYGLNEEVKESEYTLVVEGAENVQNTNSLGSIRGEICIGGVIGYNDEATNLVIRNVKNSTPIIADSAIAFDEQSGRRVDYADRTKTDYVYSYVGGIIGKVGEKTTIDACTNSTLAPVSSKGTYRGGLTEVNEGKIINCLVATFGSSMYDYVGGLCGLNKTKGSIESCSYNLATITGRNVCGGFAAENFGTIEKVSVINSKMNISGTTVYDDTIDGGTTVEGVSGMIAGYNKGLIKLDADINFVTINSKGDYVGGMIGINDGFVDNGKIENELDSDSNINSVAQNMIRVTGSITGRKYVGGIIGKNISKETGNIVCYSNYATVTATAGFAGGIVGQNVTSNKLMYCTNEGVVSASNNLDAGGITSINAGEIFRCYDYATVLAPSGRSGGIAAINEKTGIIEECGVEPKTGRLGFTSLQTTGGIVAINEGLVEDNYVRNIDVSDYTVSQNSNVGVVVGINEKTGTIKLLTGKDSVYNCTAKTYVDNSFVGGVAGTNEGIISGANPGYDSTGAWNLPLSVVNVSVSFQPNSAAIASFGGVTGSNYGKIEHISVQGTVEGDLSSNISGYGGITGVNGYASYTEYENAKTNRDAVPATVFNCTFDGMVHANGAGAAIAKIGGIAGINGYGGDISRSYLGVSGSDNMGNTTKVYAGKQEVIDENGITTMSIDPGIKKYYKGSYEMYAITEAYDKASYAYIGGIAGENFGRVTSSDNALKSTDTVKIYAFSSIIGGIVGFCEDGQVTGTPEERLSSGKNWEVLARSSDNDRGCGGIIGTYSAIHDLEYIDNYAKVTCNYSTNPVVGGIAGFINQNRKDSISISNSVNYGEVNSFSRAGGFVGLFAYGGLDFEDCINYGTVSNITLSGAAGFIQYVMHYTSDITFVDCINHGAIRSGNYKAAGYISQYTGAQNGATVIFNNCVNTGVISAISGDKLVDNGVGFLNGTAYFDNCRNYGSGEYYSLAYSKTYAKNCLSAVENKYVPFAPELPNYFGEQNYYIRKTNSTEESKYGVGAILSTSSVLGNVKNDRKIEDYFATFTHPRQFENENKDIFTMKFNLEYKESSNGLSDLVLYPIGGNGEKYTYSYSLVLEDESVVSVAGLEKSIVNKKDEDKIIIPLSDGSVDYSGKQVKTIYVSLSHVKKDNTADVCKFYGFGYIPVDERDVICALEDGNQILSENTKTSFTLTTTFPMFVYNRSVGIGNDKAYFADYTVGTNPEIDTNSLRYTQPKNTYQVFDFDITYSDDAAGIGSLYFYLNTENAKESGKKMTFNYYARVKVSGDDQWFYIKDENDEDFVVENASYRQEIKLDMPEGLSGRVEKIELYLKSTKNSGSFNVYMNGFKWSEKNSTKKCLLSYTETTDDLRVASSAIELKETYDGESYIYTPTIDGIVVGDSFSLKNQVQNEAYYADRTDYDAVYDHGQTNWINNGRVDVYKELDGVYERYLATIAYDSENQLAKPTGLVIVNNGGKYRFEWDNDSKAYGYVTTYQLLDMDGNVVYPMEGETIKEQKVARVSSNFKPGVYLDIDQMEEEYVNAYAIAHPNADPNTYTGYKFQIVMGVKAISVYSYLHAGEADADSKNSEYAYTQPTKTIPRLPKPITHVEVIAAYDSNGNYSPQGIVVIDNKEDYVDVIDYVKEMEVSCGKAFFNGSSRILLSKEDVLNGYSKPFTMTNAKIQESTTYYSLVRTTNSKVYYESIRTAMSGALTNSQEIASNNYLLVGSFEGFFGTTFDSLSYKVGIAAKNIDVYTIADITAKDSILNVNVSYDYGNVHAASMVGSAYANFRLEFTGLPNDLVGKDFEVRSYLFAGQSEMIRYGHEVTTTTLTSFDDVKAITDENFYNAYGKKETVSSIVDTNGNLLPGYVIFDNQDGTYTIYYSATLALDDLVGKGQDGNYSGKYQIHRYQYQLNEPDDTSDNYSYYMATDPANTVESTKVYIQPEPIIDDNYTLSTNSEGKDTYTFTWDTGKSGSMYDDAVYNLELYGTTPAGKTVSLETLQGIENNTCTFVDTQSNWNYSRLTLEVERVGTVSSVDTMNTAILPSANKKDFKRKIRLTQLSTPQVQLTMKNGVFDKTGLIYEVIFDAISDETEEKDLGGYLITVSVKEPVADIVQTKTHYYYITDIRNQDALFDEIDLDLDALSSEGVVVDLSAYENDYDGSYEENARLAKIDLSDFAGGEVVSITVQPISRKNATVYYSGYECEPAYELTIPKRNLVPNVENLGAFINETDLDTITEAFPVAIMNDHGIVITMEDSNYSSTSGGNYNIAIALYDDETKEAQMLDDVSKTDGKKKVFLSGDAPSGSEDGYWNSGAYKTILSKSSSTKMTGAYLNNGSYTLQFTGDEKLSDYAGYWMKIVLRSESNNTISSWWSDEDPDNLTTNYRWVYIPRGKLETPGLTPNTQNPYEKITQLYLGNDTWSFGDEATVGFKLENRVINIYPDDVSDGYEINIVGKDGSYSHMVLVYDDATATFQVCGSYVSNEESFDEKQEFIDYGILNETNKIELPYYTTISTAGMSGAVSEPAWNTGNLHAALILRDNVVKLVLPDYFSIYTDQTIVPDSGNVFTDTVTVCSIVNEEHKNQYENSAIGGYIRDDDGTETIKLMDVGTAITSIHTTLSYTCLSKQTVDEKEVYPMLFTATAPVLYRLIVLKQVNDLVEIEKTVYGVTRYVDVDNYNSQIQLDASYFEDDSYKVLIQGMYFDGTKAMNDFGESYYITQTGYGTPVLTDILQKIEENEMNLVSDTLEEALDAIQNGTYNFGEDKENSDENEQTANFEEQTKRDNDMQPDDLEEISSESDARAK